MIPYRWSCLWTSANLRTFSFKFSRWAVCENANLHQGCSGHFLELFLPAPNKRGCFPQWAYRPASCVPYPHPTEYPGNYSRWRELGGDNRFYCLTMIVFDSEKKVQRIIHNHSSRLAGRCESMVLLQMKIQEVYNLLGSELARRTPFIFPTNWCCFSVEESGGKKLP